MKKSLEERLRYAVENHKLNFEKFFGRGCKWYHNYLIVWELVWARNFCDGYQIFVYDNEYISEHNATFVVEDVPDQKGEYCLVPKLQTDYIKDRNGS